jgi:Zn-dependent protease
MLFQVFLENPVIGIVIFICIAMSISIHEAAHAFTAIKLGDSTPKIEKRNTFNPLSHLDPIGSLMLVFIGIGWGKPVHYNPFNLKNLKRDEMLIALSGPVSNFIMAIFFAIVMFLLQSIVNLPLNVTEIINFILLYLITINITLGVFNLMPIEPLDGFKVVGGLLPKNIAFQWEETRRYGIFLLMIFLITGMFERIIRPIINIVLNLLSLLLGIRF